VSNAVQTIQAANDGITSITKLVASAQATANQAQQLSETVDTSTPAAAAVSNGTTASLTNASLISAAGFANTNTLTISGGGFNAVSITFATGSTSTGATLGVSATVGNLITEINAQAGANIASIDSTTGKLKITGQNTTSDITVGGTNTSGLASSTHTAAITSSGANPARGALIAQYNGLLDQIDQLTADAGYNGNNLLAGSSTQLKVVFNETGTSNLTISGKDASSSGLGLTALGSTAFDTNASITTILGTLKTATDTLRSDASSFGSNLSIVQTRQDFTKALINTLQTGASNLTLADSNEEAANLLALQTRQQLSSTALSMASQADQAVLRLF
jgi:flagellin